MRKLVSAVGGDREKRHGIILAKSIPAKKYHIQTGETVVSAKEKCPGLILVPPNYDLYNRSSKALIKLLSEYTDKIECAANSDDMFLQLSDGPLRNNCDWICRFFMGKGYPWNANWLDYVFGRMLTDEKSDANISEG